MTLKSLFQIFLCFGLFKYLFKMFSFFASILNRINQFKKWNQSAN